MSSSGQLAIDGVPRQFPSTISYIRVDEPFFPTLSIRVTEGRNFTDDDRTGSPPVALVTESLGRLLAERRQPTRTPHQRHVRRRHAH